MEIERLPLKAKPKVDTLGGFAMREIPLSRGLVAVVDDADYGWLSAHNWCVNDKMNRGSVTPKLYAVRAVFVPREQRKGSLKTKVYLQSMHREIMGCLKGDPRKVDHIDGNSLNNQRVNLRFASSLESSRNIRKWGGCTSDLKGAHFDKTRGKWKSEIKINRHRKFLGRFGTAEEAHVAYCAAAKEYFGEYANTSTVGGD